MSNGLASLPRYTYDPRTQTYQLVTTPPPTLAPEEKIVRYYNTDGDGNPSNPPDGRSSGSGGALGGLGLGLMSLSEAIPFSPVAAIGGAIGRGIAGVAADKQAQTMTDLAKMNEQAIQSKTTQGLFGPVAVAANPNPVEVTPFGVPDEVSVTSIAPDVAPGIGIGEPGPVSVSAIGPDAVSGLAAMNEAVAAQNEAQASPASVAAAVANAVASDPGAVAEAAEAAGVADAAADAAAGVGGGGDEGVGGVGVGGGDVGGGDSGDSGVGGDTGGQTDTGAAEGGWRSGGSVEHYQLGGSIMGMGESQPGYAYAPIMMSRGGLPAAARKVQSQGRGDDTMLVHMTPQEVKGLQAIAMAHGGSLSINPETGLPEAGFLKNILPMVAGAALAATGVGAPMAALMVGGGTALFSGSLEKGLMAGLGAFGGAGLGAGLSAAGATAPTLTGTQAALTNAGNIGAQQAVDAGINIAAAPSSVVTAPGGFLPTVQQMGTGLQNVVTGAPGARGAFMSSVGGPMGLVKNVGAAAAPIMFSEPETAPEPGKPPQTYIRPYAFDFNRQDTSPEFRYRTGAPGESTAEQTYLTPQFTPMGVFKAGQEPGGSFYGTPTQAQYDLYSRPRVGLAAGGPVAFAEGGMEDGAFVVPADVVSHLGNGSNDAGQEILARGLGARPIRGDGDGMSDDIPTMIEGEREARVADGEAYIPASVVKKVGAKRLYAMMDKIRRARTGKEEQAPEIDAEEFLPA